MTETDSGDGSKRNARNSRNVREPQDESGRVEKKESAISVPIASL
jgi:hypothetical protein